MQTMWPLCKESGFCYRKRMLIRGNHTNSYAEAGMRILNELLFSCIKAYNVIQMFHFITKTMERYYQSKLRSVAHSRVDSFIFLHYQGLHARAYNKEKIHQLTKSQFSDPSRMEKISLTMLTCKLAFAHVHKARMDLLVATKQQS